VKTSVACGVKVLDLHATIAARVEAERQRRIEEVRQETIANAIATVKARLEAEAAAREQLKAQGKTHTFLNTSDYLLLLKDNDTLSYWLHYCVHSSCKIGVASYLTQSHCC